MSNGLSISLIPLAMRRINGVKTVSSGALNRNIPQDEYVAACKQHVAEGSTQPLGMLGTVNALWKTEGLSTTLGKYRLPENTLNDPRIPQGSLGIAHVGYGAASTEHSRFDAGQLHEIAETKCSPRYRGLSIEGIGSILRIYEPGLFKFMCGQLGLIPKNAPPGPDKTGFYAGFFADFTPEEQRLIVHGYGRLIAFSKLSIYQAIEEALTLPKERVGACVMGTAFAFVIMNAVEISRILNNSAIANDPPVRAAFQDGLVYAIVFCEWFTPGLLAAWKPQGALEEHLIAKARSEADLSTKRGYILPFALENPVSSSAAAV